MSDSDQYLWVHGKDGYQRAFYIKLDEPPYYFGNQDYEILNFRPSDQELTTWIGERNGSHLVLTLVDDDDYLKKEYPSSYSLKKKYDIAFALLELNDMKTSEELYLIATCVQATQINSERKRKGHGCVIL